jgi:hypothetical protein
MPVPGFGEIGEKLRRSTVREDFEQVLEGSDERVVRLRFLRGERNNVRTVAVRLGLRSLAAA